MSYKAAGILSALLIVSMFVLPAAVEAILVPSLPDPVPLYEQILLRVAFFCAFWHFAAVIPILVVLFTLAAFTRPRTHS